MFNQFYKNEVKYSGLNIVFYAEHNIHKKLEMIKV